MREAEPVKHVRYGRECLNLNAQPMERRAHLLQRDPDLARRDRPQRTPMRLEDRTAMATDLGRGRAAGLSDPLHQLDRRRRAHLEAQSRRPRRISRLNKARDPLAQILRQLCPHAGPPSASPRHRESELPIPCTPKLLRMLIGSAETQRGPPLGFWGGSRKPR